MGWRTIKKLCEAMLPTEYREHRRAVLVGWCWCRFRVWRQSDTDQSGSANANNSGTVPPTVIAMYCFPSCMYVIGVPMEPAGRSMEPTISPLCLLRATSRGPSSLLTPPAVRALTKSVFVRTGPFLAPSPPTGCKSRSLSRGQRPWVAKRVRRVDDC